jgi:hypothetical protein
MYRQYRLATFIHSQAHEQMQKRIRQHLLSQMPHIGTNDKRAHAQGRFPGGILTQSVQLCTQEDDRQRVPQHEGPKRAQSAADRAHKQNFCLPPPCMRPAQLMPCSMRGPISAPPATRRPVRRRPARTLSQHAAAAAPTTAAHPGAPGQPRPACRGPAARAQPRRAHPLRPPCTARGAWRTARLVEAARCRAW